MSERWYLPEQDFHSASKSNFEGYLIRIFYLSEAQFRYHFRLINFKNDTFLLLIICRYFHYLIECFLMRRLMSFLINNGIERFSPSLSCLFKWIQGRETILQARFAIIDKRFLKNKLCQ